MGIGSASQLHSYGRQLQSQGHQDQAFEIFRINIKKNPNHWLVHSEIARLASAQSRFDEAVKEMKLAVAGAPAQSKPAMEGLLQRLQAKEDINK
jgi:tetratricopeptide (TPR) repeat protein